MTPTNLDFLAIHHGLTARDCSTIGREQDMDVYARLLLLTLALPDAALKEVGRGIYRDLVHASANQVSEYARELIMPRQAQMEALGLTKLPVERLKILPDGAFALRFTFKLRKPYLSRDDETLYVVDSPVAKDRVFRVPLVRSSSWKGALRSAVRLEMAWKDSNEHMVKLFGSERGEDEAGLKAGRLVFYTTFFNRIGLEIINPHDRERKVGVNPILLECVPVGAEGMFQLLYAPFDLMSAPQPRRIAEVYADLRIVSRSLTALMTQMGFSAKRTSGYGVIQDSHLDGRLWLKRNGELPEYQFDTFAELKAACETIVGGQDHE